MKEETVKITPIIDEWMKDRHYHHPAKGCRVVHDKVFENNEGKPRESTVNLFRCMNCQKDVSRGGWEWGWYGGTYNR